MDTQEVTKVLLIERDPRSAQRIEPLLADNGSCRYRLTSIASVEAAAAVDGDISGSYDVVVLDLADRAQSLNQLLGKFRATPVVVMTDSDREDLAVEAVKHGALDYVVLGRDESSQFRRILRSAMERKRSEERLRYIAHHDAVTGLPNRGLFRTLLEGSLARARRNGTLVALLILDIDRFKWINESLGYRTADALLGKFAKRLKGMLRESDIVARMGGDEFAVILEGVHEIAHAQNVAEKVLASANDPFETDGRAVYLTTSIGISLYPTLENNTLDALTTSAEIAAYRAKHQGRNNYQVFAPDMYPECTDRVRVDTELRDAIARDEFVLHYQPQIDLRTGRVVALEALVRWQHPKRGILFPGDFIQVAEDSGLIVAIGECVLKRSCQQLADLRHVGFPDLRIAVNLSPLQFRQEHLPAVIARTISQAGIHPDQLELELTESTLIENTDRSHRILEAMKSMGVRISIDDFGTGYSSLSYLQHFPLDILKIDRSFVSGLGNDRGSTAICEAVVSLARALDLMVIAEGVETTEQLRYLQQLGCDIAQGFLFSRAVPVGELPSLLGRDYLDPMSNAPSSGGGCTPIAS